MPWRVLSGYRPYQVHPTYFSPPSPSPTPGGNSSSSHAGNASSPPPPSSPTRPERQQLVATALSSSSPAAAVPLAVPSSASTASSIGGEASQARPSAYRSNHTVPGLSLFIPAARFLSNPTPSLHHSLSQSQNRNHPSNAEKRARHHSSTAPTKATATDHNRNWTRHTDDIPSLFHPQHQTPHPYHQHQRRQQTRMDPTIARLFTSNEQWKEAVGQAEPSFFAETAKGQAPKVCVSALTSTPSRLSPSPVFLPDSFFIFRPHYLT